MQGGWRTWSSNAEGRWGGAGGTHCRAMNYRLCALGLKQRVWGKGRGIVGLCAGTMDRKRLHLPHPHPHPQGIKCVFRSPVSAHMRRSSWRQPRHGEQSNRWTVGTGSCRHPQWRGSHRAPGSASWRAAQEGDLGSYQLCPCLVPGAQAAEPKNAVLWSHWDTSCQST